MKISRHFPSKKGVKLSKSWRGEIEISRRAMIYLIIFFLICLIN
jgi:hypothetical protein